MKKHKRWCKVLFIALCVAGILWFCLPLLHGGFAEGSVFGVAVCAFGIAIALRYGKMISKGGWQKVLARMIAVCYALGLCWVGYLTGSCSGK